MSRVNRRPRELNLKELWLVETAAEARSSLNWTMTVGKEGVKVYSPSLGPARRIVSIAVVVNEEFGKYIAAFDPGTIRRLLEIASAAERYARLANQDLPEAGAALAELTKALEGVTTT